MLLLASASPRRKEILSMIIDDFEIVQPVGEELVPIGMAPSDVAVYLAEQKANEVFAANREHVVIAADTVVELDGSIFGKPHHKEESITHLQSLSGRIHRVHTGVCIAANNNMHSFCATAEVAFDELSRQEIEEYVATGEPVDKAGSYAIQGLGGRFVKEIVGDYYTVMGLPLNLVYRHLKDNGFI